MPEGSLLDEVVRRATTEASLGPRIRAQTCNLATGSCSCATTATDSRYVELGPAGATGIHTEISGWSISAESWDAGTNTLSDVIIVQGERAFYAGRAKKTDAAWVLHDTAFGKVAGASVDACGWSRPTFREQVTADAITLADPARISSASVGLVPLGDVAPDRSSSGLLPPALRFNSQHVEAEASAYLAPLGSIVATAAPFGDQPAGWYGGGLRLHGDREQGKTLDLQAVWSHEDGVQPLVWGKFGVGNPRQRIDVQLEHPSYRPAAELRRLESDAFLRGFRRSVIGANLSGPTYGFRLDGTWLSGDGFTDVADLRADFGGNATVAESLQLDFGVDHRSTVVADESTHSSTAAARLGHEFGSRGGLWFNPALTLFTNYGVIPAEQGFEASSSGGILASVDTSASWTGRLPGFLHLIGPRLQIGRELLGIAQRAALPADAPEYLFTRVPTFTWAALALENTIIGNGFQVSAPVGALVYGDDAAFTEPRPFGRLQFQRGWFDAGASAVCGARCDGVGWLVSTGARGNRSGVRAHVGEVSVSDVRALWFTERFDSPGAPVRLSQVLSTTRTFVGRVQGEVMFGRFGLSGHTAVVPTGWTGGYGGASYTWRSIGVGISAMGGWDHEREEWTAMVGLSL